MHKFYFLELGIDGIISFNNIIDISFIKLL